jgi:hypothetical protein
MFRDRGISKCMTTYDVTIIEILRYDCKLATEWSASFKRIRENYTQE